MPRPLRICFVAYRGNMRCGGQGVYLWNLVRHLSDMGHCVDVLVGPPHPDPMPFANSVEELPNQQFWAKWFARDVRAMLPRPNPLGIFEPLNFYELCSSYLGFLPEPFAFSMRAFRVLARRIQRGIPYDLVHDVQCLGYGILGVRALGLPVVTTVHHPLTVDREASFVRDRGLRDAIGTMAFYPIGMQSWVARRIERVLTSSTVSAQRIASDFGVPAQRIAMVANGVATDIYCPDSRVSRSEAEILCVGRASDPNKGVGTLIEALALLPEHVHLTLVDDAHPDNPARKRAAELGCDRRLRVVGRVSTEELVNLYRRATVVAVPSRYEGFGLPVAEAMACGTPVVATDAGALREVLETAGGGVMVSKDDPASLAKGIATQLEQPRTRGESARRARDRIVAAYAWPRIAEATAGVYADVVQEFRDSPH